MLTSKVDVGFSLKSRNVPSSPLTSTPKSTFCSRSYDEMVKSLTAAQLQEAARLYFDTKNYARFVLLPEAAKTTP